MNPHPPPPPPPSEVTELARQVASLTAQFEAMRRLIEGTINPRPSPSSTESHNHPRLKLDVLRFNGTNTHGWIFKISQFFTYHQTPEEERITIASFYLDGAALAWY